MAHGTEFEGARLPGAWVLNVPTISKTINMNPSWSSS
jgi:hypothetical protein